MRNSVLLVIAIVLLRLPHSLAAPPKIGSFLETHCFECHDSEVKEGGLDLSTLRFEPRTPENFEKWVLIHDRVRKGDMPPEDAPKLAPSVIEGFSQELSSSLVAAEREILGGEGRTVRRRMNRYEYENTLQDLFGIPVLEVRNFLPEDRVAFGSNKVGAALDVSYVQMNRYLEASDFAMRQAMAPQAERPKTNLERYYAWDMPGFRKGAGPDIRKTFQIYDMEIRQRRRRSRQGPEPEPTPETNTPHDREKEAVLMVTSTYEPAEIQFNRFRASVTARYKLRFSGYSVWMSPDFQTVTRGHAPEPVTVYSDRTPGLFRKLFSYDVGPDPTVVEKEVWMIAGETIRPDASRLVRCRPPDFKNPFAEDDGMPGVAWQWMEVEGPIFDEWPPAGHQLLFDDLPLEDVVAGAGEKGETDERLSAIGLRGFKGPSGVHVESKNVNADAERLLRRFMNEVYRRPLVEEDVESFLSVAQDILKDGDPFEEAMLSAYTCVLSSPAFIYFNETPGTLDDRALADRLAYFLWNSRPDKELLGLSDDGQLHLSHVLRQQTDRMLDDPRSDQFVTAFLNYWLDLRLIERTSPDVELYPEYDLDDLLVESAVDETHMFFAEMLNRNLGISNLVDSDFTFLNGRLAIHYGLPDVDGVAMRKVSLPVESVRGGILTHASVLKVTANGTTTSPVIRGAWVMSRLLGKEPPPPPSAVPAVEPDTRGATTIREQLVKHRSIESCNACHRHIDPVGFALENFDVLGGWRNRYRSLGDGDPTNGIGHNGQKFEYRTAQNVDSSGVLPDGQEFKDIRELKDCLLRDQQQLARNMIQQLLVYSTGAQIRFSDRPVIDAILAEARGDEYGLRTLVHEVVQSELFRRK